MAQTCGRTQLRAVGTWSLYSILAKTRDKKEQGFRCWGEHTGGRQKRREMREGECCFSKVSYYVRFWCYLWCCRILLPRPVAEREEHRRFLRLAPSPLSAAQNNPEVHAHVKVVYSGLACSEPLQQPVHPLSIVGKHRNYMLCLDWWVVDKVHGAVLSSRYFWVLQNTNDGNFNLLHPKSRALSPWCISQTYLLTVNREKPQTLQCQRKWEP